MLNNVVNESIWIFIFSIIITSIEKEKDVKGMHKL